MRALPFTGDDDALLCGLHEASPPAVAAFCDRHFEHVQRILIRILGRPPDLLDLTHDVFVRALASMKGVKDAGALRGWISIIAVNVARSEITRRRLRRWLSFLPWSELPEVEAPAAADEELEALRRTYAILEELPADERIALALRVIDGMELADVAAACGVSLATIKRRLQRAEAAFLERARREPSLEGWLEGGARWTHR